MPRKLGYQAKLYRNTGDYASPSWVEITNAKDVTTNLEKGEADVTTRGNQGWRATAATLKDLQIEFQMIYDTDDASYGALEAAFFNDEIVEIAVADGAIETAGTKYLRASMEVFNFSRSEQNEEAITVDVTMKPTFAANAPTRHTAA
ncbi:MAG: phage tail tube protein [Planctomycetota bacterium]